MTTLPAALGGTLDAAARAAVALVLERVQEHLLDSFYASLSANTVRAYRRDHEDFRAFIARLPDLAPLSSTSEAAARLLLAVDHGTANGLALGYRNDMVSRGLQPATVNRRLAALRSLVRLGNTLGLVSWRLDVEAVDSVTYRDTRGPGRDGVRAMVGQAKARGDPKGLRDLAILRLLHDVALRRGEVVSLDLGHYDARRSALSILGKGRKERELVSLPPPTKGALDAWVAVRGKQPGPLFHRLDRAGAGGGRLTGTAVYQIVQGLGAGVGIATRPHGLRHSAITTVLDTNGGDVRAAQRFSRHRSVETLQRYDDNRADLGGQMAALIAED